MFFWLCSLQWSVVYFFVATARSGNQEVACYHFHSFQILHKLVHCALSHVRCWTSTKWRPVASVPPKWCVERGFVTGLCIKTFLPETIFDIYGELLCFWKSGHNFLHLWAFALDGWLCSNCEGQGIYATCCFWQRPTYWRPTRLVQLPGWWRHRLPSHPVSLWSGFIKPRALSHGEVNTPRVALHHR